MSPSARAPCWLRDPPCTRTYRRAPCGAAFRPNRSGNGCARWSRLKGSQPGVAAENPGVAPPNHSGHVPQQCANLYPWRHAKNRHCSDMAHESETQAKAGAIIIPVTLFEQNCTLLWCTATKKAVVIDPGGDVPKIQAGIKQANVTVEKIWLTHGHIDHVGGAAELRDALKVPIDGPHFADKFLLDNVVASGARFGMTGVRDFAPDRWLEEGNQVNIGELTFDILHCPGHSPGSVVFFNKEMRFAHVGDVLFNGSVGRSDIPGGNHATLIKSIKDKLLPLGDDVGFICGHGPGSSIGQERLTNPFLNGAM